MAIDVFLPESPVPCDKYTTDDLPFTAFGQYGEGQMDLRVFDQDIYWVNIHGEPFYLNKISPEYVSNLINFLMQHAEGNYLGYMEYAFSYAISTPHKGSLKTLFHKDENTIKTATEWLASTVLMQKLIELNVEHLLAK
jgi:hypothetical protein